MNLQEKSLEWFEENEYYNPRETEFEKIFYSNKDVTIKKQDLSKLDEIYEEDFIFDTAIIIDGDLHIDSLDIFEWSAFYIKGDVYCDVFSASDDGYLECKTLFVKKYADLLMVNDIETLDVRNIKVPIAMTYEPDDFNLEAEFIINEEFEDADFEEVYKKLKSK